MMDVTIPADQWADDEEAVISTWLYADGDQVQAGSIIAEIMVGKATFELFAPESGMLKILAAPEIVIMKGQIVGRVS